MHSNCLEAISVPIFMDKLVLLILKHQINGIICYLCFPDGASDKEPACQCIRCKRYGFNPWVGKIPWRRKWQPTPVFLPGKEVSGKLHSMGSQRVRYNRATEHTHALQGHCSPSRSSSVPSLSCFFFCLFCRKLDPTVRKIHG